MKPIIIKKPAIKPAGFLLKTNKLSVYEINLPVIKNSLINH